MFKKLVKPALSMTVKGEALPNDARDFGYLLAENKWPPHHSQPANQDGDFSYEKIVMVVKTWRNELIFTSACNMRDSKIPGHKVN